jgi:hypothetical protein
MGDTTTVCCLCGKPAAKDDPLTREHVPPKQFYPKPIRSELKRMLWIVPTHKSCNNKLQADEDYFYHAMYLLVANANPLMADVMFDDIERRAEKPQTRVILQNILETPKTTTGGGIILPPGVVRVDVDTYRLQQVALKIGRCLFYRDHERVMPSENCKDIRLCEFEEQVPEFYRLSWKLNKRSSGTPASSESCGIVVVADIESGQAEAVQEQVFDYRSAYIEASRIHLYSLRFWEAFFFCMTFMEPDRVSPTTRVHNTNSLKSSG